MDYLGYRMPLEHVTHAYSLAMLIVVLAQASPGPNFLAVASAALWNGRAAGLCTVLGVATGMLVWAAAVALGLAIVLELYPSFLTLLKILGGLYLIVLAWKIPVAASSRNGPHLKEDRGAHTHFAAFQRGILVILTNPKAALMWIAVATYLFSAGLSAIQVFWIGPMAFITGFLIYGGYVLLFSSKLAKTVYQNFSVWIDGGFCIAFAILGFGLLFDSVGFIAMFRNND